MFTNLYSGKTTNEDTNNNDNNNFFTSLFNSSEEEEGEEDKKQKERQLRIQNLNMIEAGEKRRQQRVYEDKFLYLFIFALQFLPLCGNNRYLSIGYFFSMAVTTVYLGGRQEVIEKAEQVSRSNALYAPIGASLAIGGLYLLLKVGIDVTSFYAVLVSIFGTLAIAGKRHIFMCSYTLLLLYCFGDTNACYIQMQCKTQISAYQYYAMCLQMLTLHRRKYPFHSLWQTN